MTLNAALAQGLLALQLPLASDTQAKLLVFLDLLKKWNRVYNLTAIRDPSRMLTHHVLDSLSIVPHISASLIVDIGSGAGFPGIPLSLALPGARITLLESSHKKASFLKQAAIELGLDQVEVVNARAETWTPPGAFDVAVSRAFADLETFSVLARRLCKPQGLAAAMKGDYPAEELAALGPVGHACSVIRLHVPGLDAQRHLVLMPMSYTC